jgi:hypothetical protein
MSDAEVIRQFRYGLRNVPPGMPSGGGIFALYDSQKFYFGYDTYLSRYGVGQVGMNGVPLLTSVPAPTSTTLGGVESKDCTGTGHVLKIGTDGTLTCSADAGGSGPATSPFQIGATDTGISRTAAGTIAVGNGTQGDTTGTVYMGALKIKGNDTSHYGTFGFNGGLGELEISGAYTFAQIVAFGDNPPAIEAASNAAIGWNVGNISVGGNDTAISRISAGIVGVGTGAQGNTGGTVSALKHRISSFSTPATSSDTCTAGDMWADANYIYLCTATNTIKRAALSTF